MLHSTGSAASGCSPVSLLPWPRPGEIFDAFIRWAAQRGGNSDHGPDGELSFPPGCSVQQDFHAKRVSTNLTAMMMLASRQQQPR